MKKYLIFTTSISALAACSGNIPVDTPKEIRLSSSIHVQSRAYTPKQSDKIALGEKVYVWADEAGSQYFNAWELLSDGVGSFDAVADADKKYFPSSGNPVDLYAIHGNFPASAEGIEKDRTPFPSDGIIHMVETDQVADGNYERSDLLYASHKEVAPSTEAVALKFYHMLSKVEIAVRPGEGLTLEDLQSAAVSVVNTNVSANFTPAKLSADETGDASRRNVMVEAVAGTAEAISVPAYVVANDGGDFTSSDSYGEAIIVPQTLNARTQFIKVALDSNSNLYYTLPSDVTFEGGKKYVYHITVNLTGLTVKADIEDWAHGSDNSGDAELQ